MDAAREALAASLAQAAAYLEQQRPEAAYRVLSELPVEWQPEIATRVDIALLKHRCLCEMDQPDAPDRRLLLFNGALMLFYQVTDVRPYCAELYERQAAFWARIGSPDRAAALLRTLRELRPDADTARAIAGYEREAERTTSTPFPLPDSHVTNPVRRVLLVTHPRSHYGLDIVYDGLCEVLGDLNVVEYPWKPMLHGQAPRQLANYPCALTRAGAPRSLEEVAGLLRDGAFDAVLWGDFERRLGELETRRLVEAAHGVPFFMLDMQDECTDAFAETAQHLGVTPTACFKREMLATHDYGERVFPLPFAYPASRVWRSPEWERLHPFFWAGQRWCGLRDVFLRRVESILGQHFDAEYSQEDYIAAVRSSRAGFAGFGAGFDTVRYWELPAHGCLLLAQRSPIRVPHDFRGGESALFFDDLADLEDRVLFCLAHPDAVSEIARAGHAHLCRYHTSTARARQLLDWIGQVLFS